MNNRLRGLVMMAVIGLLPEVMAQAPVDYVKVVNDVSRMAEARARDAFRQPAGVLALSGLNPGDVVLEIAPASGYYTGLLSRVVGDSGQVFAVDPARIFEYFPDGRKGFQAFVAADPRKNVSYSVQKLDEIEITEPLDQIWMVLYYHDTLWTGENRSEMNDRFYRALKSGGRYLVIDHHARRGADAAVSRELHRMEKSIAVSEITRAGFELVLDSDLLANPDDTLTDSVFDENRRGETDRFLLIFEKP